MSYPRDSPAGRFLSGEVELHAEVCRWVAQTLTLPRFRMVRPQWVDLHQEVLHRIVESLRRGRFDNSRDFRVYCQSIARYTARDAVVLRIRESRNPSLDDDAVPEPAGEPEAIDARRTAGQLLDLLSEECRELFRRYYLADASYEEIAKERGIPVGTVKSRIFRCLKKARDAAGGNQTATDPKVD